MKPLPLALDCRTCGACCISTWDEPGYVDIENNDLERLAGKYTARTVLGLVHRERWAEEDQLSLKTKLDKRQNIVCVALRGTIARRVSCRIYEFRPDVCRSFRPGTAACLAARREAGMDQKD